MAGKRGGLRGTDRGRGAAAAGRIPRGPLRRACQVGQGPAKRARSSETPDKRETRLAREAENKVNENSMEREARPRLARAHRARRDLCR
eukprot:747527-Hanusia_phi.AAC.2